MAEPPGVDIMRQPLESVSSYIPGNVIPLRLCSIPSGELFLHVMEDPLLFFIRPFDIGLFWLLCGRYCWDSSRTGALQVQSLLPPA